MFIKVKTFQNQSADDSLQLIQALCHEKLVKLLAREERFNWKPPQNIIQAEEKEHCTETDWNLSVQLELP